MRDLRPQRRRIFAFGTPLLRAPRTADIGDLGLLKSHSREMGQALKIGYRQYRLTSVSPSPNSWRPGSFFSRCQPSIGNPGVLQVQCSEAVQPF